MARDYFSFPAYQEYFMEGKALREFAHLHCHSEFSFIPGAPGVNELCDKACGLGMRALALTDSGNLCAAPKFYEACKRRDIKPILGSEVYLCQNCCNPNSMPDAASLVLLVQNKAGYANLIKLSSLSWQSTLGNSKPCIDKKILSVYTEGLICLSGSLSGEIPQAILAGEKDKARKLARELAGIFPGRFYLELQKNGLAEQEIVNSALLEISESEKIPVVATNDCHYLNIGDRPEKALLLQSKAGSALSLLDFERITSGQLYVKSAEQMGKDFRAIPEAFKNAVKIAKMCEVDFKYKRHFSPAFPLPVGKTAENRLAELAREGLNKKGYGADKVYVERLENELATITKMGFASYFLVVQDYVRFARENYIQIGPGRGSAPGSMVLWALGVTEPDPIKYNLLFERFINSELRKLPDIDVDVCSRRPDEIANYLWKKYGNDRVARLPSFGLLKAKKDLEFWARRKGISQDEAGRVIKSIPPEPDGVFAAYVQKNEKLRKLYETDSRWRDLIDFCIYHSDDTVSCIKSLGIIISDIPLAERAPVWTINNTTLVQYDRFDAEKLGLTVFDFLRFQTLTVIGDALENIKLNKKSVPVLEEISLDEEAVFSFLASGDRKGIFQLDEEGEEGMAEYFARFKPDCFTDVIALLSLNRPGPVACGMMESFIRRKNGEEAISYIHPCLKSVLKETYGVLIYQEQVMQIAAVASDYTLQEADNLRRTFLKRKVHEVAKERARFVTGAKNKGISRDKAAKIFSHLEYFTQYTFNKSHAVAYALLTYRTAWLKLHYPLEFMAACEKNMK